MYRNNLKGKINFMVRTHFWWGGLFCLEIACVFLEATSRVENNFATKTSSLFAFFPLSPDERNVQQRTDRFDCISVFTAVINRNIRLLFSIDT